MKKRFAVLTGFAILLTFGCKAVETSVYIPNENSKLASFSPGLEPDGFNGIRWESSLSSLKGMKFQRKDPSYGGLDFFLKEGDTVKLGEEVFTKAQYGFWQGRFYVGLISTKTIPDWELLKKAVFRQYGEGAKPFHNKDEYLWIGNQTVMALQYNEILKTGVFYIRSESMLKEINAK